MKTQTKSQRSKVSGQRDAAKRSLAAHKANWTRALRKAYPEGSPVLLTTCPQAEIDREVVLRAMRRTDRCIASVEKAIGHMRAKQLARLRELETIERRLYEQRKGGAS